MAAADLRAWHEVDWRFLLPDPHLGPVWLAPECADESTVLRAMGVEVVGEPSEGTAMAFVDGLRFDVGRIERALPAGALVRVAIVGAGGLGRSKRGSGWSIAGELEGRGWQVVGRFWAVGGIETALAYADLDDRLAVTYWWRTLHPGGARARLTVAMRCSIARIGLWRVPCHEGFVFARTPA